MKKIYFVSFVFIFCHIFTGCFWCQLDEEPVILQNTDFFITPEKDAYSIDEEIKLNFSSIVDFSYFTKYCFDISLREFTEKENNYVTTENLICYDGETKEKTESFEYDEKDTVNNSTLSKTFLLKASQRGKFSCKIKGIGYHFNEYGGSSPGIRYDKCIYIDVVE